MKRHPDEEIIYGLFDSSRTVEHALKRLIDAEIPIDDISILMNEDTHERDFAMLDKRKTKEGAVAGGVLGGTLGGILGGVASLGAVISGIGLVIVGPMIALAATGGLLGGLIGHGIPREEAERLHAAVREGKALIAVHTHRLTDRLIAHAVFDNMHAEPVETESEATSIA